MSTIQCEHVYYIKTEKAIYDEGTPQAEYTTQI